MLKYIILALVLMTALAEKQSRRIVVVSGGKQIAQDFVMDEEENTLLVTVGDVSQYKDYRSTVNLHDFNTGWIALKDINGGTCLLKPIPPETDDHKALLKQTKVVKGTEMIFKSKELDWDVVPGVLSAEDIVELAGPNIAGFCNSYKTMRLEAKSAYSRRQFDMGYRRNKRYIMACFICNNFIDGYEADGIDFGTAFTP